MSRSHNVRMRALHIAHVKDTTILRDIWAEGHVADTHLNKKVVKMSPSVPEVVFRKQNSGNDGNKTLQSSRSIQNSQLNSPGHSQCLLTPESCLLAVDLGIEEKKRHTSCLTEAVEYMHQHGVLIGSNVSLSRCSCHLKRKRPDNRRVALISLPGSGNTWVRGLLEHVTNICTGAMWCDPNLRASQFCGEGLHSERVLVVKNHDPTIRWRGEVLPKRPGFSQNNKPEFDAAIFVHRNPYDAMVAEHNREVGYALWETTVREKHHLKLSVGHHIQSFGAKYFSKHNVLCVSKHIGTSFVGRLSSFSGVIFVHMSLYFFGVIRLATFFLTATVLLLYFEALVNIHLVNIHNLI